MSAAARPLKVDADLIERMGALLSTLKGVGRVKVRTLTVDIADQYGDGRTRVRLVGDRSRWGRSVEITKVERLEQ